MQIALGPALIASKGYVDAGVGVANARAKELCERLGDDAQLALVLRGQQLHQMQLNVPKALPIAEELAQLAERRSDSALRVGAQLALAQVHCYLGEPSRALTHAETGIEIYDPATHRFPNWSGGQPGELCYVWAAISSSLLGHHSQAMEYSDRALEISRAHAQPFSLANTLALLCAPAIMRGDPRLAQRLIEESMAISSEYGIPFWLEWGRTVHGWTVAKLGQPTDGLAESRQGIDAYRKAGNRVMMAFLLSLEVETCLGLDRVSEGLAGISEALAIIENIGERWWEAEMHRLKGVSLLRKEGADEAEDCLQKALEVAREQQAKSLELRAAVSLGRLWQQKGKRDEAHDLLAPVYNWFTEGFDTSDLKDAKALLEQLS
jgi:predicted ATPase